MTASHLSESSDGILTPAPAKQADRKACSRVQAGPVKIKIERKKCSQKSCSLDLVSHDSSFHYSDNISAKECDFHSNNSSLDELCSPNHGQPPASNFLTVQADIHDEYRSFEISASKEESDTAPLDQILDDSSMYNEGKLARLASIDELIEYEEEIADLAETFDNLNIL